MPPSPADCIAVANTSSTVIREQEWHADLGLVDGDTVGGDV